MVNKKKGKKITDSAILSKFNLITNKFRNGKKLKKGNNPCKKIHTKRKLSFGQQLSDWMTHWAGSWTFIIGFIVFLVAWMIFNVYGWVGNWDPFPFILLNLVLSCLAALQAPVILMSQNRSAERDRHKAELDYMVNRKAERENKVIIAELQKIKRKLKVR